jgi:small subunit ribosomal protein S16
MGAKKSPYYRIVVTDKRSPRDGRFIEAIGTYDPNTKPETVQLEMERAAHWLANGAQASDGAIRILRRARLVDENGRAIPLTPPDTSVAGAENATA